MNFITNCGLLHSAFLLKMNKRLKCIDSIYTTYLKPLVSHYQLLFTVTYLISNYCAYTSSLQLAGEAHMTVLLEHFSPVKYSRLEIQNLS